VAQGHVLDTIEKSTAYLKYKQRACSCEIPERVREYFSDRGAAFNAPLAARGAAFGDLNNDGSSMRVVVLDGRR
jgi:hypothetical protein